MADLVLSAMPILKAHYKMTLAGMKELKAQLDDLVKESTFG